MASDLVKVAAAGGAAYALYEFWWKPRAAADRLKADLLRETAAEQARSGASFEEAFRQAARKVCVKAGSYYKVPPATSGPICDIAHYVGTELLKIQAKAALAAGRAVGKGAKVVGREVATGAKAVVKAPVSAAKGVASVAKKLQFWGLEGLHS